jgi:hypothetical protein
MMRKTVFIAPFITPTKPSHFAPQLLYHRAISYQSLLRNLHLPARSPTITRLLSYS